MKSEARFKSIRVPGTQFKFEFLGLAPEASEAGDTGVDKSFHVLDLIPGPPLTTGTAALNTHLLHTFTLPLALTAENRRTLTPTQSLAVLRCPDIEYSFSELIRRGRARSCLKSEMEETQGKTGAGEGVSA